ncbi:hypothetical protein [Alienimonas sp. DA493]|uniref:hypothetical protein n=1 Tax=Alienimonas sp. DA493 TaxID=3373605 RepID=UPI0037549701
MNVNLGGDFAPVMICYVLATFVLTAVVHVMFTVGVWTATSGRRTELVPPWVWIAATLLGGPLVAAAYWVVHLSSIARPPVGGPHQEVRTYDSADGRPAI